MTCVWLLVSVLGVVSSEPNWVQIASGEKDPQRLVKRTLDMVLGTLQSKQMDIAAKQARIVEVVTTVLDVDVMARLAIGRYWSAMTRQQQQRFTTLFYELLKDSYVRKLADYNDQKVVMRPGTVVERRAQIPTDLVSKDKTIPIVYKLHLSGDRWKIYDVEIDGVSLVMTYRAQFQDILAKATIDELLTQLEERLKDPNQPQKG